MARNDEDYDFFGDGQYDDSRSSRRAQNRRPSRRDAGRRFAATKASSPTSILCRRLAVVSGLLAVVVSATSAVHEIAPYAISFMTAVPGRYIALTAAVLIGITLILVIAARVTMPRYATHGGVGAGGIIALVCAIVCLVIGVAVGVFSSRTTRHPSKIPHRWSKASNKLPARAKKDGRGLIRAVCRASPPYRCALIREWPSYPLNRNRPQPSAGHLSKARFPNC